MAESGYEPFGGLIASGWHTTALYMSLFVRSQPLRSAVAWPSETMPSRGNVVGEHQLVNQRGEVVMRMPAWGYLARRPVADQ